MQRLGAVLLIAAAVVVGAAARPWRLHELRARAASKEDDAFGIVIDAGSTGSRLHVFTWKASGADERLPANLSLPVELAADAFAVTPGISDPKGLAALDDIISHAQSDLAAYKANWSDIPIFLKATAGMRILPALQRQDVMVAVRAKLAASGFQFLCESQARVMSGEEEGVFGWLTVNKDLGRLKQGEIHNLHDTVGALDMGGASTQITFKPLASPDILANLFPVNLGQQVAEDVYTHSFLHFGENEAQRRANRFVALAAAVPAGATVANPCYLDGYTFQYEDLASGIIYNMAGSGNFTECSNVMIALMDRQAICLTDPNPIPPTTGAPSTIGGSALPPIDPSSPLTCSIGGIYQPPVNVTKFVAFSGFSFIWNFLKLAPVGTTPAQLASAAATFCGTSWEQAKRQNPSEPEKYLSAFCATATLSHTLLTTGYGIPAQSTAVTVALPSTGYDWALGSILWDANQAFRLR